MSDPEPSLVTGDPSAGVAIQNEKRRRWFEVGLVLIVAFANSFLYSPYRLKNGPQHEPSVSTLRWAANNPVPHPAIAGVTGSDGSYPGHSVVVAGKQGSTYITIDPPQKSATLADDGGKYQTRGSVKDQSGLDLALGDGAELLITSPSGERTGFDPGSGGIVQHIPRSAYFRDSLGDDVTGEAPTETSHFIDIFQPQQGNYQVLVSGLKLGTYSLSVNAFNQDGGAQPGIELRGISGPGSASTFQIQFSSTPGSSSTVTRTATFASTLADVSNSLQLGLISSEAMANHLVEEIRQAAKEAAERDAKEASRTLREFKDEVRDRTPKVIKQIMAQILLEDADSLLAQLAKPKEDEVGEKREWDLQQEREQVETGAPLLLPPYALTY